MDEGRLPFGFATNINSCFREVFRIFQDQIRGIFFSKQRLEYFLKILAHFTKCIQELLVRSGFHFLYGL